MMVVMAPHGLGQSLDAGELAAGRGIGEVRRKLGELIRRCRIPARLGGLGGGLQVGGDLRGDLLVLGWVGLLQLLQCAHQLREWRKLAVIRLRQG